LKEKDAINIINYCYKCEEVPFDANQGKPHYPSRFKNEDINQKSTPELVLSIFCWPRLKRDKRLDEYKLSALHISSRHFDVHS
jgi:hypothetical protein